MLPQGSNNRHYAESTPAKRLNFNASSSNTQSLCSHRQRSIAERAFMRGQVTVVKDIPTFQAMRKKFPSSVFRDHKESIYARWLSPIVAGTEADIENILTTRISDTFEILRQVAAEYSDCICDNQETLGDRSRLDLILIRGEEIAPICFEIKKGETLGNIYDHSDQIVAYGMRFFAENASVGTLIVVLTDGNRFYLGRFFRSAPGDFEYALYDHLFELYDADQKLIVSSLDSLLRALYVEATAVEHVMSVNVIENSAEVELSLVVKYYLASGSSSSVYIVEVEGIFYALKMAKKSFNTDIQKEVALLTALKDTDIALPLVSHSSSDYVGQFLLSPLGCPAKIPNYLPPKIKAMLLKHGSLELEHFKVILNKVAHLHRLGYVHRDLRLDNILIFEDIPYLSDFGCSLQITQRPSHYEGTVETASQKALKNYGKNRKFVYSPLDDLESLFKCFILWHFQIPFKFQPGISRSAQASLFWSSLYPKSPLPDTYDECLVFIEKYLASLESGIDRLIPALPANEDDDSDESRLALTIY